MTKWEDIFYPTFYENWHPKLKQLSFATTALTLEDDEIDFMLLMFSAMNEQGHDEEVERLKPVSDKLENKINDILKLYPNGAYFKLGSRGPKDSWYGHKNGFKINNAVDIFRMLDSERIWEDLGNYQALKKPAILLLREWHDIKPEDEWRCFCQYGRFLCVSQYDYHEYFKELQNKGLQQYIIKQAQEFLDNYARYMPYDVVYDLWIPTDKSKDILLIEINPFNSSPFGTDPCLYKWDEIEGKVEDKIRVLTKPIPQPNKEAFLEDG